MAGKNHNNFAMMRLATTWLFSRTTFLFLVLTANLSGAADAASGTSSPTRPEVGRLSLWWRQPAPQWDQAMPVGNGRLGAMVFGAVEKERLQLNEDTLWSGGPQDPNNPEALKHLPEVRQLLFAGKPAEAMDLANKYLMGTPRTVRPYQSLGDINLSFANHTNVADYWRDLDLDSAIARVHYTVDGVKFTREVFSSAVDQVLVIRLSASQNGKLSCLSSLSRSQAAKTEAKDSNRLVMSGQLDEGRGLRFQAILQVLPEGGSVSSSPSGIEVKNADSITFLLVAATSYLGLDPVMTCEAQIAGALKKPYTKLRDDHAANYQKLFRRMELNLGESENQNLPTDERLSRVQKGGDDPQLLAQYFQFGRYLLISSSRPGNLPANLQGLWADGMNPPWNSDFHLNINLQMNYWPAEVCNLSECTLPLFDLLDRLREPGRKTAQVHYGSRGFVAHHITDPLRFHGPRRRRPMGFVAHGRSVVMPAFVGTLRLHPRPGFPA